MRILFLVIGLLLLPGCQTIYDYFAEDSCTPGNTPAEERQCLDHVEQNSGEHSQ
jgi:hypothetical protein